MKCLHPILLAVCIAAGRVSSAPVFADAPQPGNLSVALTHNVTSLGEPLVLKYKLTNFSNRRLSVNIDNSNQRWLTIKLVDAKGTTTPASEIPVTSRQLDAGVALDSGSCYTNHIVIKNKFQPVHPGQYHVVISTHLIYSWEEGSDQKTSADQQFSLPLTITSKDVKRLHDVAEALRQTASHNTVVAEYQSAIQSLFSMQDATCQPVWKELATDPTLDAYRALEVAQQLAEVSSTDASDILIQMQSVSPERWAVTGSNPLDALEEMRQTAKPNVREHIDQLLTSNGVELTHVPAGSVD